MEKWGYHFTEDLHGEDAKTRKLIANLLGIPKTLDPNHATKDFDHKLAGHCVFTGIKAKLRGWTTLFN
jgi:hypothetical protein